MSIAPHPFTVSPFGFEDTEDLESSPLASSTPTTQQEGQGPAPTADDSPNGDQDTEHDESDTFPRAYVEKLRRENASYRERAKRVDELVAHGNDLQARLHTELVRATGRLADPDDLPFDEAHLDDSDALAADIDALLADKPHLASRRPKGDVGQGATRSKTPVDLAAMLRARA